jgi:predicted anti-sigma-YlaC factor YlaD
MNAEQGKTECAAVRAALLGGEYGADDGLPPALRGHLQACAACQADWAERRELLNALQVALAPEPLPEALRRRIEQEMARGRRRRSRLMLLGGAGAVAAACVLGALLVPTRTMQAPYPSEMPATTVTMTPDDAAAIAAAVGVLTWDSPVDYSLSGLTERVQDTARQVGREHGANTYLPWSADDDWDMPSSSAESSQAPTVHCARAIGALDHHAC